MLTKRGRLLPGREVAWVVGRLLGESAGGVAGRLGVAGGLCSGFLGVAGLDLISQSER